jgi:hypothetical protein
MGKLLSVFTMAVTCFFAMDHNTAISTNMNGVSNERVVS